MAVAVFLILYEFSKFANLPFPCLRLRNSGEWDGFISDIISGITKNKCFVSVKNIHVKMR